jgi:hypothetical protein
MDAVIIIAVFLICLGIPFALAGLWWWFTFWWIIGGVLALTELVAKLKTGKTISQMFWVWKEKAPRWKKLLILGGMIVFWGYLIMHLYFKW